MKVTNLAGADSTEQLLGVLNDLNPADDSARIGLDTEFMRERTYFAQLCLVQVAAGDEIFFVDPLEGGDPDGIWPALLERRWVLHSGRQDVEVIFQSTGDMPAGLFDTQIAAALAGFVPQIGYAGLIKALFDRELPKSHTRADWTRRPLTENMLRYAAEDVEYLLAASDTLSGRLDDLGRLPWALEDSATLLDPQLYRIDVNSAEERLKGARNLQGRARRIAVALARWREQRALGANRPRQWILKDAVLLSVANTNPDDGAALSAIDGMPASTVRRSGQELLHLIAAAAEAPDDAYRPPARPGEKEKKLLKALQKEVSAVADELGIAAEVIAPRKELSALVSGQRDGRSLSGWRREVIGNRLLSLLD